MKNSIWQSFSRPWM